MLDKVGKCVGKIKRHFLKKIKDITCTLNIFFIVAFTIREQNHTKVSRLGL